MIHTEKIKTTTAFGKIAETFKVNDKTVTFLDGVLFTTDISRSEETAVINYRKELMDSKAKIYEDDETGI